jgi:hypothetical protein
VHEAAQVSLHTLIQALFVYASASAFGIQKQLGKQTARNTKAMVRIIVANRTKMNYVGESRGEVLPELLVASRMRQDDNTP